MLSITFGTGNAQFESNELGESAELLRAIAANMDAGDTTGTVRDINGNTIGGWYLVSEQEPGEQLEQESEPMPASYVATLRARSGLLIGGVREHSSARFASRRDAFSWGAAIRDANRLAKRDIDPEIHITASGEPAEIPVKNRD